jgi:membrane-bound metal-dependent hydrolase YbcI (DUF457 family)
MIIGANAVWIAAYFGQIDQWAFVLMAAGAFAALLPDIDAGGRGAKIHYVGGGILKIFRGWFQHRGFFHSFMAVWLVYIAAVALTAAYHALLPAVIATGYASHLVIDAFNRKGARYLFPVPNFIAPVPKIFTAPVKGWTDYAFFALGLYGIFRFVSLYGEMIL